MMDSVASGRSHKVNIDFENDLSKEVVINEATIPCLDGKCVNLNKLGIV